MTVSLSLARCLVLGCCIVGFAAHAADAAEPDAGDAPPVPQAWAVHGQVTNVTQSHPKFRSPYAGTNSLAADGRTEETTDVTLYAGVRPWRGAELWINPEVDQGFGLSNTVGVAGFPSGEAYKIGSDTPYLRLPRVFLRQVFALGGDADRIDGDANQLAGTKAHDNVTVTLGKLSVTDLFDTNTYAHDPRADFLNWSVIDAGVFDYAADPWGFTYGGAVELTQGTWTIRGGLFELSPLPNGKITSTGFSRQMWVGEGEARLSIGGHPGKIKLLAFVNRAGMSRYDDAVQLAESNASVPDVALVRRRASRAGVAVNGEQELSADLGAFARLGWNDGRKEAYEFTEIDRSFSAGFVLKGGRWGRERDTLGLAVSVNGLSDAARRYFGAGGIGILIGDGRLDYESEQIVEATYVLHINETLALSADYQRIDHPAYNRDRGPVSVYSLRAHAEF